MTDLLQGFRATAYYAAALLAGAFGKYRST